MAVISAPLGSSASMSRSLWRDLDWSLLLLVGLISLWSLLTITSATRSRDDSAFSGRPSVVTGAPNAPALPSAQKESGGLSDAAKQTIWVVAGMSVLLLLAFKDYQFWMHLQPWLYILTLGMLAILLFLPASIAPEINGAKSWVRLGPFALQPSEFAKFTLILSLSGFVCRRQQKIRELPTLLGSLLFLLPPLALILKQPDFGTCLAVIAIWFGTLFFGGARLRHLGLIALIGIIGFAGVWQSGKLKPHQKARLAVFLNNNPRSKAEKAAERNEGYQIKQSQIAIGSGQIAGQGWGQGMQNRAGYVPENTTDFIFTVVAEETGFVGGAALLFLYLLLLLRTSTIAMNTDNYFGVLIAGGFTALLAFHAVINLGMTMRVMPITGVPLPFFSYGGSSYLTFSLCAGLLQSIVLRQKRTGSL